MHLGMLLQMSADSAGERIALGPLAGGLTMAEAFGVDGAKLKNVVFLYAALLACVSGWLYAHLQRFVLR